MKKRHEQGVTLIEVLVALGILGLVAAVFLSGVALTYRSVVISQERVIAESLAKSQLESIKSGNYSASGSYGDPIPAPSGYSISYTTEVLPSGPQKVTVYIYRNGDELFKVEDYKVDR